MPLAEARTILGDAVDAVEHDAAADLDGLRRLAIACRRFSPVCGVEEEERPESILLDVTGCGHLFGGEEALAAEAVRFLRGFGVTARAGLGPTVGAAWAAGRTSTPGVPVQTASDAGQIPTALLESSGGGSASGDSRGGVGTRLAVRKADSAAPGVGGTAWWHDKPLALLRLPDDAVTGLAEFDIRTVGQLRRLPRTALPSRFGEELLRRLDQADGTLPEPIRPILPVETPRQSWTTEHPLRRPDLVEVVLERLAEDLVAGLPDGIGLGGLRAEIASADRSAAVDVMASRPTRSGKRLHELLCLRLERVRMPHGVDRVSLEGLRPDLLTRTQVDLFGEPLDGRTDQEFDSLVDRLSGRLGAERVCRSAATPDPLPENAVAMRPAAECAETDAAPPRLFARPTRLLPEPVPLRVWAVAGRPRRVQRRGQLEDVREAWGPEVIETGWWREADHRRSYFRAELAGGECLWLFRRSDVLGEDASGAWFLHGVF